MSTTAPSPQTWTIRLKSRKTTVLLHTNPLETFSSIKHQLYTALSDTTLKDPDTGDTIPLPSSASDIQLGRPVNPHDASRGFALGEWEYDTPDALEEGAADVKGKGKAVAGKGKSKRDGEGGVLEGVKGCPKGAGLRDGAVLAFRWRGDGIWDGDEDVDMEEGAAGGKKADMWGVRIASFEDSYGVENEGDVGGMREFEG